VKTRIVLCIELCQSPKCQCFELTLSNAVATPVSQRRVIAVWRQVSMLLRLGRLRYFCLTFSWPLNPLRDRDGRVVVGTHGHADRSKQSKERQCRRNRRPSVRQVARRSTSRRGAKRRTRPNAVPPNGAQEPRSLWPKLRMTSINDIQTRFHRGKI